MNILCHINPAHMDTTGVEISLGKFPEPGDKISFSEITESGSFTRQDTIVWVLDTRGSGGKYDAEVWTATAESPTT